MSYQNAGNTADEEARVSCQDCGRSWFGPTAAHGLSVLGQCPRCGGSLRFRDEPAEDAVGAGASAEPELVQPWQVLGTPSSWH